jgi:hypothetical protein
MHSGSDGNHQGTRIGPSQIVRRYAYGCAQLDGSQPVYSWRPRLVAYMSRATTAIATTTATSVAEVVTFGASLVTRRTSTLRSYAADDSAVLGVRVSLNRRADRQLRRRRRGSY